MKKDTRNFVIFMIVAFIILLLTSCTNDVVEEIQCVDFIELNTPIVGDALENRSAVVEDIYFKGDTIVIQSTKEYDLNQYRITIEKDGSRIKGGYKWWYGVTTASHLHRTYKIPAYIPDCYNNFSITFGIWDEDLNDYIEIKTVDFN